MSTENNKTFDDMFQELKSRLQLIFDADPSQYQNDYALKRYLRAFQTVDQAFQSILKTNKWRREFGIDQLTDDHPIVKSHLEQKKAFVSGHRDMHGRPVIYIPTRRHNVNERDIEELTKFIAYVLEKACSKCFEEVIDNVCVVFDLKDFGMNQMDYQFVKTLIWLLSRHYPERLGVCIILNSPMVFQGCWTVIRGWLNEVTANKVVFVSNEMDLCQYLHPDILPNDV